jgi:hypothetical protein
VFVLPETSHNSCISPWFVKSELVARTVFAHTISENMNSSSHLLLLLFYTVHVVVNAAEDVYDFAIRQVMSANGLTGSAVAFYDGVSDRPFPLP